MDNKQAVLWDMDGVLIDSSELHYQAWLETLTALSIPFDRDKFQSTLGMNNNSILTFVLGKPPEPDFLQMVCERKESLFKQEIRSQLNLLPGALFWLKHLSEVGILQAVASSGPYENLEAITDVLDIRRYFAALISADTLPGKPDPAVFLEACRRLGSEQSCCIVVEDSIVGIAAAKSAGMKCIAVATTHPRQSLAAADIIVDSLEDLTLADFN
jgi:HAD superfamily hydrolase (TIGR01509 family)